MIGFYEALRFELAWSLRPNTVNVKVPSFPSRFALRRFSSDISVFSQVFIGAELAIYTPPSPRLIIDGGANIGLVSAYYAVKYPDAEVIAVEPSADNYDALRHNCARLPNVRVIRGGLWHSSGFLRITNLDGPTWGYRCEAVEEGTNDSFRAYTIDEVIDLSEHGCCDLLKLDIEGAEEAMFAEDANRWISRVDAILVEVYSEAGMEAIAAGCPDDAFEQKKCGEKLLLRQRA